MRRMLGRTTVGAVALLLAAALTACDTGPDVEDDPRAALVEAIEALADYDGVELVLAFEGDADAISAATDGELGTDTAQLVLDSALVVRAAGQDASDGQGEFVLSLGGDDALELRVLPDEVIYLRVDLDAVAGAIDDPQLTAGLEEFVETADAFGMGELAAAARDGEWIQVTGFEQFADLGMAPPEEEPTEDEVEDVRERVVASFERFLDEDVQLEYVGDETAGERIRATTTEADLAALFDEVTAIASDLSGFDPDAFGEIPAAEGSDDPVHIDFWLEGGELSQVGYDLTQVDDEVPDGTYVLLAVEEFTGSVQAPDAVTEVDLFELFSGFLGGDDLGGFEDFEDLEGFEDADDLEGFEDDPAAADCIPEEEIDELVGDDEEARAELDVAIEMGIIEVC